MVKLKKIQTHRKSQPKELIKQAKSRINRKDKTILQINDPQWSRQFFVEENPLCGQRRSLLAQIESSNNRNTQWFKFLIAINQLVKKDYLGSNAVVCRGGDAPVPLLRQITILMLAAIEHLHMQETRQTQA